MLRSVNSIVETRRSIHCRSIQSEIYCVGKECTSRKHADCSSNCDSTSFVGDFWFRVFVFVHCRSSESAKSDNEGRELQVLFKDCDSKYGFCLLCSVDVKRLQNINAPGSGYFCNVVNYVIEGLDE